MAAAGTRKADLPLSVVGGRKTVLPAVCQISLNGRRALSVVCGRKTFFAGGSGSGAVRFWGWVAGVPGGR